MSKNNTVYFLSREPSDFKKLFYVGRTKNLIKRRSAHKRKKGDFAMYLFKIGLSKPESSVYEQALLTAFTISKLQEQGGGSGNKIRAIAISKVKKFITTIGEIAELQANSLESKILYLQGR